jgi:hypothetical protein
MACVVACPLLELRLTLATHHNLSTVSLRIAGALLLVSTASTAVSGCFWHHRRDPDVVVVERRVDPDDRRERREERHDDRRERREERRDDR